LYFKDLEAGGYEIQVKSAAYRSPERQSIEIEPGRTAVVRLVLEQMLGVEGFQGENVKLRTLLRTPADRRLVFRTRPELEGDPAWTPFGQIFDSAAVQVYSTGGWGDDYTIFPGDAARGATTNFALVDSWLGRSKYIFAGQLNSGEDSLWRLRNIYKLDLSDAHAFEVYLGYARMSFQQPGLALLGNPLSIGGESEYTRALGTTNVLNLGFEDSYRWSDSLAVAWGVEVNQVRHDRIRSYVHPSASVTYYPAERLKLNFLMSSRRPTLGNTLTLPDGNSVSLADSLHYARLGDRFSVGTARYFQASLDYALTGRSSMELALFSSRRWGGTLPVLALIEFQPEAEVVQLDDHLADTKGYRLTWRHSLAPNVKTAVCYMNAYAMGFESSDMAIGAVTAPAVSGLLRRRTYHGLTTQVEALIPHSRTSVTTLMKVVMNGSPVATLDPYADVYETSNQGMNVFVRQIIPLPATLLNFVGLDFLAAYRWEALLDLRNLMSLDSGVVRTAVGDMVLVRMPRSVRGGIALRF
jgi:hypothetical protein